VFLWHDADPLALAQDDELAHHPVVLVLQQVAVVHVRHVRVGVVAEPHRQPVALITA
jgi:hypothetical protein